MAGEATSDSAQERPVCKHCGRPMTKWRTPQLANWDTDWFWVCFEDDCEYFQRGWAWMEARFEQRSSYRYHIDPASGNSGPLPVWSVQALKNGIIEE